MEKQEAQAVVVGAGPAGCAAAIGLASQGVDVALVEARRLPRVKVCGGGLSPRAIRLLDKLKIKQEALDKAYKITDLILTTPSGKTATIRGAATAYITNRMDLDKTLADRAVAAGARLISPFKVRSLIEEGGRVVGVTDSSREIRAPLVIVANGALSSFSPNTKKASTMLAMMAHYENISFTPHTIEMVLDRNLDLVYGWLFPEGERKANVGIVIRGQKGEWKEAGDIYRLFIETAFAGRCKEASPRGPVQAGLICGTLWPSSLTSPGRVLVGEAARLVNLATGEGIHYALSSGLAAAEAMGPALKGKVAEGKAREKYESSIQHSLGINLAASKALINMMNSPTVEYAPYLERIPLVTKMIGMFYTYL